jgi:hypothetical protein
MKFQKGENSVKIKKLNKNLITELGIDELQIIKKITLLLLIKVLLN